MNAIRCIAHVLFWATFILGLVGWTGLAFTFFVALGSYRHLNTLEEPLEKWEQGY